LSKPLRVLLVVIDLRGGVGVFCRNLATGLARYYPGEFAVSLLLMRPGTTTESDRSLFSEIRELDAPVHDDYRRFFEALPAARALRSAIKTIESDVILTIHNHPNLLVPLVAPNRRIILSVHGHLSTLLRASVTRPVLRTLIRRRYRDRLVVTPTQGVADDLAKNFNVTNARVIPHGVDIERVTALADAQVADLPTRPYMAALGRLVREKDYPTMLQAFAEARKQGLQHRLAIIGSGELERELKELAGTLNVQSHTEFLGHRDNPYPYLKHADLFVMSSISEGFGLALVEALALGLPCIATDCPSGPAEILDRGKYGALVVPQVPQALANAMLELARNPQRRDQLTSLARQRSHIYSLAEMARRYRDLLLAAQSS